MDKPFDLYGKIANELNVHRNDVKRLAVNVMYGLDFNPSSKSSPKTRILDLEKELRRVVKTAILLGEIGQTIK